MLDTTKKNSDNKLARNKKIISVIIIFISCIAIILLFPPPPGDWQTNFYPVSKIPLHPYIIRTFNYPPWTALILFPLGFFSEYASSVINSCLNIIVIGLLVVKRKGDVFSLILTLTSFPFIALIANNNIEWIPALGFILQNGWGLPLLLTKPQSGIFALLSWLTLVKNKMLFLVPTIIIIIISFIVWGNWIASVLESIKFWNLLNADLYHYNLSLFPWTIPIGLGLIFFILKNKPKESEILGVLATFCLLPYFASQALIILFALISVSHRRIAIISWIFLWLFLFK